MKVPDHIMSFGDLSFRGKCEHEDYVLTSFVSWLRREHPKYAQVALHPKNEGKRSPAQFKADLAKGFKKGASDIIIIGNPTLCLELKIADSARAKWSCEEQITFLTDAQKVGAISAVGFGLQGAKDAFLFWLSKQA